MAYLPKDYSKHENKIILGLSFRSLLTLFLVGFIVLLLLKATILPLLIRIILLIPVIILGAFMVFYKTAEGDDLASYLFDLIVYYCAPKYLVYEKKHKQEKEHKNERRKS